MPSLLLPEFALAGIYQVQGEFKGALTLKEKQTAKKVELHDGAGPLEIYIDTMKLSDGLKEMMASRFKLELRTQSGQSFRFRVPSEYFHEFSEFSVPAKVTGQNVAITSTRVEDTVVKGNHSEKVSCEYDGVCTACSYSVNSSDPLSCANRKKCPGKKEVLVEDLEVSYHYVFQLATESGVASLISEKKSYPDTKTLKDLSKCEEQTSIFDN